VTRSRKQAALFLVPSLIYWLHNNVQFLTLKYVDPSTYQILGNLKIVTTGVLFWVWLRRHLSPLQWMALLLLMIGAATSQVGSRDPPPSLHQPSFLSAVNGPGIAHDWGSHQPHCCLGHLAHSHPPPPPQPELASLHYTLFLSESSPRLLFCIESESDKPYESLAAYAGQI